MLAGGRVRDRSVATRLALTLSCFREGNGFRTAYRIVHERPATGRTVITIETGLTQGDGLFFSEVALGRQPAQSRLKSVQSSLKFLSRESHAT